MFYISYDLARQIGEQRRAEARRLRLLRELRSTTPPSDDVRDEADVVELVFGTQCEPDRLGA